MQGFCWVEIVFILYDSTTFSHICYIKMVKELLRIFLFSDFKIISYRIAAGEGRRGLEFHISRLKMFEFAVSDQKNHRDSLNFRGPGRSGRQKLFYAYISLHQACLVNQLKFSHLYF